MQSDERHLPRGPVEQPRTSQGRESDVISGVNTLGATGRIFLLPQPSGAFNYPRVNTEIGSGGGNRQDKVPTQGGAHTWTWHVCVWAAVAPGSGALKWTQVDSGRPRETQLGPGSKLNSRFPHCTAMFETCWSCFMHFGNKEKQTRREKRRRWRPLLAG